MPSYIQLNLFGGAMTVSLPEDFADVSTIREVPDNQEVYLSRTGLTSVIFDIVERAEPPEHPSCTTDAEALTYHFEDLTDVGYSRDGANHDRDQAEEETKNWGTAPAIFADLPDKPAYTMFATQQPKEHKSKTPDFTAILLTLLRLPQQKTDIIITVNVPHVPGETGYEPANIGLAAGRNGPLIEEAMAIRTEVLKSFKVVDWNLFAG